MAKVTTVKSARKPAGTCIRCRHTIEAGQSYQHVQANRYAPKLKKHTTCEPAFQPTETMSDTTLAELYEQQADAHRQVDEWGQHTDGLVPDTGDLTSILEQLADAAGAARDEYQERFDNIPENFQEGDRAQALQEKIDGTDGYESELQSVDFEEYEDLALDEPDVEHSEEEIRQHLETWIEEQRDNARGAIDSLEV